MRRISPVPLPDSADWRTTGTGGFTFVEVLIALLLCTLLVSVVCASLIQIANARQRTRHIDIAGLEIQRIACLTYLNLDPIEDERGERRPHHETSQSDVSDARLDSPRTWRVWTLHPALDPGFTTSFSMRSDLPAWPRKPDASL